MKEKLKELLWGVLGNLMFIIVIVLLLSMIIGGFAMWAWVLTHVRNWL